MQLQAFTQVPMNTVPGTEPPDCLEAAWKHSEKPSWESPPGDGLDAVVHEAAVGALPRACEP